MDLLMSFFLFTPIAKALLGTLAAFLQHTSFCLLKNNKIYCFFWCRLLSSFSKKSNIKKSSKEKKVVPKKVDKQITSQANDAASKKSNGPNNPTFKKCT